MPTRKKLKDVKRGERVMLPLTRGTPEDDPLFEELIEAQEAGEAVLVDSEREVWVLEPGEGVNASDN